MAQLMEMLKILFTGEVSDPQPKAEVRLKLEKDWLQGAIDRILEAVEERDLTECDGIVIYRQLQNARDEGRVGQDLSGIKQYDRMLAKREAYESTLPEVSIGPEGSTQYNIPPVSAMTAENVVEILKQTMRAMHAAKATIGSGSSLFWVLDRMMGAIPKDPDLQSAD